MKDYFVEIPKVLENNGIQYWWVKKDKYGFSRTIQFQVFCIDYFISIFKNLFVLYIGKLYANRSEYYNIEVITTSPSSNRALLLDDNFQIILEPLDWQRKYL